MKHEYIKKIFTQLKELKQEGIYLSGIKGEGEFKSWHKNGILAIQCFYKDGEKNGEYKYWYDNGQLWTHSFFKDGGYEGEHKSWYYNGKLEKHYFFKDNKTIDMSDNIKDGYILADGKYYKD